MRGWTQGREFEVELPDLGRLDHIAGEQDEPSGTHLLHESTQVIVDGGAGETDHQSLSRVSLSVGPAGLFPDCVDSGTTHEPFSSLGCSANSISTPPVDLGWMNATLVPWAPGLGVSVVPRALAGQPPEVTALGEVLHKCRKNVKKKRVVKKNG